MPGPGPLPGPRAGHPDRLRHRLRRSRGQPSPHAYQHLCFSRAFVPMSFIFQFVGEPVSGGDARPWTAPRTLRGASRPSQASSETVQGPAKPTRIQAPLFQYSVCPYEFYFSICQGACFRERCQVAFRCFMNFHMRQQVCFLQI